MHRIYAALLAAASCAGFAQAQTVPQARAGGTLSLEEALALAGRASPAIEAAGFDLGGAQAARKAAGLRPNPSLSVEAENIAGTGVYRGLSSVEATTSLAMPIELGGKRGARIAVADARARRAKIQAAIVLADMRFRVTGAYAGVIAAERRLATAREQGRIAAEASRAAESRVRAGRASPIEVQRAGVMRINADAAIDRAARLAEVARFELERAIGRPLGGTLDAAWFARVAPSYGPIRPIASAGTLALAAAEADLATADAGVRLARSQRVPDLTVSAGARRLAATNDMAAVFSLSVPLPLFNGGEAALAQASAERQRADAERRAREIEADQAIARAQAEAANAATLAASSNGPALAAAEEAARIARIGYREGKFGQLDLLDAERMLADTRLSAIDALLAYHIAEAQLERLTARAPAAQGE
ncbi:TolC family protein [Flavisphingomonas formosensis]|uniref:TolC family protein n=1 Tax=Flavisphingomonas formosensis TaxID=861534 RepID=UPI0012F903D1|nr:TolC family protein [Sphingomonas formosensis]